MEALDYEYIDSHLIDAFEVGGLQNSSYLPEILKSECLQPDRIRATIKCENDFKSYPKLKKEELISYSTRNPRTFLILAVSSLIRKLPVLREGNFTDGALPVTTDRREGKRVVYSLSDTTRSPWACFEVAKGGKDMPKTWQFNDVNTFMMHQWKFSAAVINPGQFDYNFHQECPLPYVDLSNNSYAGSSQNNHGEGHFGTVYKLGLRADHISSVSNRCQSSIYNILSFSKRARSEADKFDRSDAILDSSSHRTKLPSRN